MANKTIHTLLTKFFGNDLPEATQMTFRKWFVDDTCRQDKEEAMLDIWEQTPGEMDEKTKREIALSYSACFRTARGKEDAVPENHACCCDPAIAFVGSCCQLFYHAKRAPDDRTRVDRMFCVEW